MSGCDGSLGTVGSCDGSLTTIGTCEGTLATLSCCDAAMAAVEHESVIWTGAFTSIDYLAIAYGEDIGSVFRPPSPDVLLSDAGDPTPIVPESDTPMPIFVGGSALSSGSPDSAAYLETTTETRPPDDPGGPVVSVGVGGATSDGSVIVPF